jgi:hypothetical protein
MAKKKVPNPNGRKGGKLHQEKINEIEADILKRNLSPLRERYYKNTEGGKSRFADIVAENKETGAEEEIYQVGKQNKNCKPVKRERDAMDDIEKISGMKVIFRPYNIFILILIAIALPFLIT